MQEVGRYSRHEQMLVGYEEQLPRLCCSSSFPPGVRNVLAGSQRLVEGGRMQLVLYGSCEGSTSPILKEHRRTCDPGEEKEVPLGMF